MDLTTLDEAPAAIERSDTCAVPAAAVVAEAMVGLVLADALLERFGGDSMVDLRARVDAAPDRESAAACRDVPRPPRPDRVLRPILRLGDSPPAAEPARRVDAITPEIDTLIDDMIETMYAAPGIGLAAPQVGVALAHLRDRSLDGPRSERRCT